MIRDFFDDAPPVQDDKASFYHIKVKRGWFRGKNTFTNRMSFYERQLLDVPEVHLPLNAGNMIYIMMRRLEIGVEWEKQDALIASYRNLMYKMSYVDVVWHVNDRAYLHISGQKNDVMWAISFLTQVFPEDPMNCDIVTLDKYADEVSSFGFSVQNGCYVGSGAEEAQLKNDALPDIWAIDMKPSMVPVDDGLHMDYVPFYRPNIGEKFALPDGRIAEYIRMDERYQLAEMYGEQIGIIDRHNISASLIKDFEDLVRTQTRIDYDLYQMRYIAFMNKVHELEHLFKGLEVTVYDVLPVGERGLPYAALDTIHRTNLMDSGSLTYIIDKLNRNRENLNLEALKRTSKDASQSIMARLKGYDIEYQMYQATGTSEDLCRVIRNDKCYALYTDVAELESYGLLSLPKSVYKLLCNDPLHSVFQMTDFEKHKLRIFGRGYLDFLEYQVANVPNLKLQKLYKKALLRLRKRYVEKG